jgi:predicted short-subunit dehydrogenase-like oxidoreductase (DUF2520 family)
MAEARPAVAIVGAGAVAQAMGRLMFAGGEHLVALSNRTRSRAELAARFIEAPSADGHSREAVHVVAVSDLPRLAARVFVAVSDQGITPVAEALVAAGMRSGTVLHTCGAKGPDALAPLRATGVACGMLHPLQSIVSPEMGVRALGHATFGVSGDPEALDWARDIVAMVRTVTGGRGELLQVEPDRLSYYHAGAVMASNALVAVVDAALALLAQAGVERETALQAIAPLARTSLENTLTRGPEAAMTGPIARGDAATVAAHRQALRDVDPTVAKLYEAAAGRLLQLAKQRGLSEASIRALQEVLE